MKRFLMVILICLLLPIQALAVSYGKTGAEGYFDGNIGVPSGSGYYINGVQITSDALSDVASIAMLDESETITGYWDFNVGIDIIREEATANWGPYLFLKRRSGNLPYNVSDGDMAGDITFYAYHTDVYHPVAEIFAWVDGEPGENDMPGRLEFRTTPDGSDTGVLRQAIDNAGNNKMGDGVWTNYINVTAGGVLTAEGSATVTATNLVPTVEIDFGAHSAGFTVQTITSSEGTATIDWGNSNKARITLSENTTLAFTDPANSGAYQLIIIQPAGENAYTTTFPAGIYWANSTKVSVPTTGGNRCIVSFLFDDEDASDVWYCQGTETFATDD